MSDALVERLQEHLRKAAGPGATVRSARPLSGGACQDLFSVEIEGLGEAPQRYALRADASESLPGSVSRAVEWEVIRAAAEAGVPTPKARWFGTGLTRPGSGAYFLDWVDGEALGGRVVRHPRLEAARKALPEQLAAALAAVHTLTPDSHPQLPLGVPPSDPEQACVDGLRASLAQLPEPLPAVELALSWLDRHRPGDRTVTLNHGDFRTGNFMVGPEGLVAVLDWEFTRWSHPLDDVGWLCMRDWRFGCLDKPAGGVATRAQFYQAYATASGRPVAAATVHWWEVAANLRWATAAVYQGMRYMMGSSRDLELLAIPRRVAEMSWEALRLIEAGPHPVAHTLPVEA